MGKQIISPQGDKIHPKGQFAPGEEVKNGPQDELAHISGGKGTAKPSHQSNHFSNQPKQ
jgi:hypothetical protein